MVGSLIIIWLGARAEEQSPDRDIVTSVVILTTLGVIISFPGIIYFIHPCPKIYWDHSWSFDWEYN